MLIALGADSTKSGADVPEIPRLGFMRLPLLPLRSYCNGQSLPMGSPLSLAGLSASMWMTIHGRERGNPSGWFWYFLAIEDTFDKPKRWSRCCQVQVLRFAQQSRQFACVVHGYLSPAALGLSRKTIN